MKKKLIKILNIFVDIIVVMILIVSVLVVTMSLTSKDSGIPNVFGFAPVSVLSNSMEDTINVDDLIICQVTDGDYDDYEVGDIVTFPMELNGQSALNTHRIVEIVNRDGTPYKGEGTKYYRTQGDNKKTNPEPDEDLQFSATILAKYTGTRFGGVGGFLNYLRTQEGFFWIVLFPMILFFIYQAVRVVLHAMAYSKEKALLAAQEVINNSDLTEEQKKRAIADYLAAQDQKNKKKSDGDKIAESEQLSDSPSDEQSEAEPEEQPKDET